MVVERYSFEQIMKLGKFLQSKSTKTNKIDFIKEMSFDHELIRLLITDCIAQDLKQQLLEDLCHSLFSLSLDTSTIKGDQILLIRARYIHEKMDTTLNEKVSFIQNHIIAIEELTTSSSEETFYEILKNKIFINEDIKKNWVGICHDGASSLSGKGIGLV